MSKPYFRHVPDFDYVSRIEGSKQISNYIPVKNLFKRVKLRPDIYQNTAYFTQYTILGDERPDSVADKFYEDPTLDWIILLSNNILNIQTEWPMAQTQFDEWLIEKYGSYENLYSGVHHYETTEIVNSEGTVIIPAGLKVSEDYNVSYYDFITDSQEIASNFTVAITNHDYEVNIENKIKLNEIFK